MALVERLVWQWRHAVVAVAIVGRWPLGEVRLFDCNP